MEKCELCEGTPGPPTAVKRGEYGGPLSPCLSTKSTLLVFVYIPAVFLYVPDSISFEEIGSPCMRELYL